jgi:hypothetical protein
MRHERILCGARRGEQRRNALRLLPMFTRLHGEATRTHVLWQVHVHKPYDIEHCNVFLPTYACLQYRMSNVSAAENP